MRSKLILSVGLMEKFNTVDFSIPMWQSTGIQNVVNLHDRILFELNSKNPKLRTISIESGDTKERSDNFGYIIDTISGRIIGYVFVIPPLTDSRSGFLAQHVYPAHTTMISKILASSCFEPFNIPIYVLNINEFNLTDSKIVNIRGIITLGFHYCDIFDREIPNKFENLIDLDSELRLVNDQNVNQYFVLNVNSKTISFITPTLGSGTNDRYFYSSKAYPALYLASKESYTIDTVAFDASPDTNNSTLNAFSEYAKKLKSI